MITNWPRNGWMRWIGQESHSWQGDGHMQRPWTCAKNICNEPDYFLGTRAGTEWAKVRVEWGSKIGTKGPVEPYQVEALEETFCILFYFTSLSLLHRDCALLIALLSFSSFSGSLSAHLVNVCTLHQWCQNAIQIPSRNSERFYKIIGTYIVLRTQFADFKIPLQGRPGGLIG